jgi:para-nitrobenzyl esterase
LFGIASLVNADPAVAANIVDLWTSFANTGDPNGGINVIWPQYTSVGDQYLDINISPTVMSGY